MSLEDLAMKHVLHRMNHPKDKSESILSKMRGRYGRKAAEAAIEKAKDTMKIMDPNYRDPDNINRRLSFVTNGGRLSGKTQFMLDMLPHLQKEGYKMIGIDSLSRLGKL